MVTKKICKKRGGSPLQYKFSGLKTNIIRMESHGKKSNSSTANEQLNMHDLSFNILFFSFHCMLDVVVLILHMDDLKYNVAKLAIDSIITILLLSFHTRVNHQHINIFLTITKLTTIMIITNFLFIFIIGYDVILLIVFVTSISTEQKKEYIIQRMITKIGALIVTIITSSILEIIITLFILQYNSSSNYCTIGMVSIQNEQFLCNLQSRTPREYSSFSYKENSWINKIQNLPIGIIIFSTRDLKIIFTNQICFQYFNQKCTDFEQLEELILDKLLFQIVRYEEHGLNTTTFQKVINEPEKHPLLTADTIRSQFFTKLNKLQQKYIEIHSYYLIRRYTKIQYSFFNKSFRIILLQLIYQILTQCKEKNYQQLYKKYYVFTYSRFWKVVKRKKIIFHTQWFYNCLLNINFEESEIQLIIVDITQYHHFQVDMIQDQFKTQIVQSFSHELRTPLNSACNFLQCCLSDRNVNKETKQKLIKPAYNALRLQSHLINDTMDQKFRIIKTQLYH